MKPCASWTGHDLSFWPMDVDVTLCWLIYLSATDFCSFAALAEVLEKCSTIRHHFGELGIRVELAQAIVDEAIAYTGLGSYSQALSSLAEARQIFTQESNDTWVSYIDLETSEVLRNQGQAEKSLALAAASANPFAASGLPIKQAQALIVAAKSAIAVGQTARAWRFAREGRYVKSRPGSALDCLSVSPFAGKAPSGRARTRTSSVPNLGGRFGLWNDCAVS